MGGGQSFPLVQLPRDRVFMVTGGNTGLGYETAKWISMLGGKVIIACRSEERALEAIKRMNEEYRGLKAKGHEGLVEMDKLPVEFMKVDLASLKSTMDFINSFKAKQQPLHVLVCNAGLGLIPRTFTEDNFEQTFQVNYLSQFLLLAHFLPILKNSGEDCRIILVSSEMEKFATFNLDTIPAKEERDYGKVKQYSNSKLFQIMQTYKMSRHLEGTSVSICCGHPGMADTEFSRSVQDWRMMRWGVNIATTLGMARTPFEGAKWIINAAINPELRGVSNVNYSPSCKPASTSSVSRNEAHQEALWKYTIDCLKDYLNEDLIATLEGR